ncbi:ATP-binding cassette domain-containing protein [Pasteurella skyensis]|uniref:ATP-binding cassette domain-containing protein n=1 Tax=Phocoenobacter skyensis TaxID=97481 RepID=A0AAJ6N8I7_9PAST|nr:ATP-binding cassette domain-containing protein [Pasteurella skyensis]MDP8162019.1 ATP-binding cassette domain-containing protein [Pasteurella skyensis]MDP8172175.1 ATP-binding cassette domain-containing protein [Pasteurella skyensis]MDP8176477.1 ATP-binding cassette domain-containing protein [Pasteurella skyensis]MDP8178365.1 ATP-binding cassette domain-containing protein [Pasteurella skyensis]MDP8182879.1 ATP-binding cassette domain-containing protein [Pasteurella skyensis]
MTSLLEVRSLNKCFIERVGLFRNQKIYAVNDISFSLERGETLTIIGENGSGKSTLAKMIAGVVEPTSGEIRFLGKTLSFGDYKFRAKHIRMMFQDPSNAFDPNYNIGQVLDSPLKIATDLDESTRNQKIFETLELVGMYPENALIPIGEASNNQKQRVAFARALILEPDVMVIDDTLSTLDFSLRIQLINLMLSLQQKTGMSYVYIGQHLGIAKHISDKLLVMQQGKMIEYGNTKDILLNPQTSFTSRLIESQFGKKLTEESWLD